MAPLQLKDPLELFVKRREFLPGSGFLSRREGKITILGPPHNLRICPRLLRQILVISL